MPLPNPTYLSAEYFNWDGSQFDAVKVLANASNVGKQRTIRWDACDAYDRQTIHDLIMGYASRNSVAELTAVSGFLSWYGYQVINFGGSVVGGNNAGLESGVTYNASVVHNGVEVPISFVGNSADTFTTVVAAIQADLTAQPLGVPASVFINGDGNIEFQSFAKGAGDIIEVFDENLFSSLSGFVKGGFEEIRVGVTTIADVFDLNYRDGYQTYTELLIGKLRTITNNTPRSAKTSNDIYFNHGTLIWADVSTDLAPV